jgi:hypothetical protein
MYRAKKSNSSEIVDANTTTGIPPANSKQFPWSDLAKVFAAIGAIGGLVLHLTGYVTHQTYLTAWGIDPGLFPQAPNETVVNGFFALTDRLASVVTVFNNNLKTLAIVGIAAAIYAFFALRVGKAVDRDKAKALVQKIPQWFMDLGGSLAMAFLGLIGVPVALAFTTVILVVPILLGDSFGHSWADRQITALPTACDGKSVVGKCVELLKEGKMVAEGYMIESSLTHVALYDVTEKRVRSLERAGTELRTRISH